MKLYNIDFNQYYTASIYFRLNFTEAVLHEVHRFASMFPLSGIRCTAKDINIGGYFIPKVTHCILITKVKAITFKAYNCDGSI